MAKEVITPEPIMQTVAGLWAAGVLKSGLNRTTQDWHRCSLLESPFPRT